MAGGSEAQECVLTYRERARTPAFEPATHRYDARHQDLKVAERRRMRMVIKYLLAGWGRVG